MANKGLVKKNSIEKFVKKGITDEKYPEFEYEQDKEEILKCLRLTEQIFPNHVLMLCIRSHAEFRYISTNSEQVLGIENTDLIHWGVSEFFERIHPEDRYSVQQCFSSMSQTKNRDPSSIRFSISYRLKNNSGDYFHLLDEKLSIKNENNRYVFFTIFKNLSSEETFHHVKMNVYQKNKGNYRMLHTFVPKQEMDIMTPRQHEVAELVAKGFSNQQIADHLNVSLYTVKNHKQQLFKKMNIKSNMELAKFTSQQQSLN